MPLNFFVVLYEIRNYLVIAQFGSLDSLIVCAMLSVQVKNGCSFF